MVDTSDYQYDSSDSNSSDNCFKEAIDNPVEKEESSIAADGSVAAVVEGSFLLIHVNI